jgi:hypothetical protein
MVAYRHDCDDIIIRSLAWPPGGRWMYGKHIDVLASTSKWLFELIERTYPTISKATFQRHLDKLIEHDILTKKESHLVPSHNVGTGKITIYSLSRNTYVDIRDSQRFPRVKSNREPRTK